MKNFAATGLFLLCGFTAIPAYAESAAIAPGKIHEQCFTLTAGQSGTYAFSAAASLDFNIHYHRGKKAFYLTGPVDQAAGEGVFIVPLDQTYCLMWSNRTAAEVMLQYNYIVDTVNPASVTDRIRY